MAADCRAMDPARRRKQELQGDLDAPNREALRREATAWIARLTSGTAVTGDADALKAWRARSPEHEQAFREAAQIWKNLGPALDATPRRRGSVLGRRSFLAAGGMAASVAGGAFILSELGFLPSFGSLFSDYATGIGETATVTLPDGSTVTLDGGSTLSLGYTADSRQVTLSAGAAVFAVDGRDQRRFAISAGPGSTQLTEGSVSVTHGASSISVECIEGAAEIDCLGQTALSPGEAIAYSAQGLGARTTSDLETAAAWRKGLMIFNDRPLEDVVADLNRHRRGKVMIATGALASQRVSGVFHLSRPDEILTHFTEALQVRSVDLPGGVVVLM